MKVTELPKDLKLNLTEGIQVFNYQRVQDIHKTKINLSKNTISFLRKGNKEVIGDDDVVKISNQHFVIMKSGNCLMTENVSTTFNLYHSVLLFFSNHEVLRFLEKYKHEIQHSNTQKSFHIFEYDPFIENFVQSLENVSLLPNELKEHVLQSKFEELMLYLVHLRGASFLYSIVSHSDDKVERLRAVVDNNKLKKLSLEELAFLSQMSISTFKREFVKTYDKTPMKWFKQQRLHHVAFLLKRDKKKPIELYEEAGYDNFSNFVQAFKRTFGVTPKQYQLQG